MRVFKSASEYFVVAVASPSWQISYVFPGKRFETSVSSIRSFLAG
jgi:hypothetical protein